MHINNEKLLIRMAALKKTSSKLRRFFKGIGNVALIALGFLVLFSTVYSRSGISRTFANNIGTRTAHADAPITVTSCAVGDSSSACAGVSGDVSGGDSGGCASGSGCGAGDCGSAGGCGGASGGSGDSGCGSSGGGGDSGDSGGGGCA